MSAQIVDGRCALQAPRPPAREPGDPEVLSSVPAPAVHVDRNDPRRARDDHNPVPYQVALAAQDLLDALLGDEPFELADAATLLATLAAFTDGGHRADRSVWTRWRVLARVQELVELYNPPPELGGDVFAAVSG